MKNYTMALCLISLLAACKNPAVESTENTTKPSHYTVYKGKTYTDHDLEKKEIKALIDKALDQPTSHVHSESDTLDYLFDSSEEYYKFEAERDKENQNYFLAELAKLKFVRSLGTEVELTPALYQAAFDSISKKYGQPVVPIAEWDEKRQPAENPGLKNQNATFENVFLDIHHHCKPWEKEPSHGAPSAFSYYSLYIFPQTGGFTAYSDPNLATWNPNFSLGAPPANSPPLFCQFYPNSATNFNDQISSIKFGFGMDNNGGTHRKAILYYYKGVNYSGQCRSRTLFRPGPANNHNATQWKDECLPNTWNDQISSIMVNLVL